MMSRFIFMKETSYVDVFTIFDRSDPSSLYKFKQSLSKEIIKGADISDNVNKTVYQLMPAFSDGPWNSDFSNDALLLYSILEKAHFWWNRYLKFMGQNSGRAILCLIS